MRKLSWKNYTLLECQVEKRMGEIINQARVKVDGMTNCIADKIEGGAMTSLKQPHYCSKTRS